MAPEVALNEPYGLSADMYSFSILLWEILTLQKAFGQMSTQEHRERVIMGGERPELISDAWSANLCKILQNCWDCDPLERPSARQVYNALRKEVQDLVARDFPAQAQAERRREASSTAVAR